MHQPLRRQRIELGQRSLGGPRQAGREPALELVPVGLRQQRAAPAQRALQDRHELRHPRAEERVDAVPKGQGAPGLDPRQRAHPTQRCQPLVDGAAGDVDHGPRGVLLEHRVGVVELFAHVVAEAVVGVRRHAQLAQAQDIPPFLRKHWQKETGFAFPSGHTMFAASCRRALSRSAIRSISPPDSSARTAAKAAN